MRKKILYTVALCASIACSRNNSVNDGIINFENLKKSEASKNLTPKEQNEKIEEIKELYDRICNPDKEIYAYRNKSTYDYLKDLFQLIRRGTYNNTNNPYVNLCKKDIMLKILSTNKEGLNSWDISNIKNILNLVKSKSRY